MIIVTGGSRGLGRSICERLLSKGQEVLALARSVEDVPYAALACDVSDYAQVKAVAKHLRQNNMKVSGVVNAAGIAAMNLAVTTPPDTTARVVQVNLLGTIYCCQVFAPLMMRQKGGCFINFSTIAVALGLKGEAVYAASKAGVEGFSRAFAREMADFNIRVNCIAPGPIDTALLRGITSDQIGKIVSQQILPWQFGPDAVSDVVELLLDDRSGSLSGQVFGIGGA
ncbi:SDR family oxidoreductase [Sphingomonas elodea]|uniref:SDR family oxidoreductase n=1 Tax=Sphingomonas elodea TaxID=179878 RepID=UPI000263100F|nr:SDR family oxidoreductase [Sphingomonas elodea]